MEDAFEIYHNYETEKKRAVMNLKKLSKFFIGAGLSLLFWGLLMDTSVQSGYGRVVNIGLANDRLVIILVGGFLFCGGLVVFAFNKSRVTKEEELEEIASEKQKWEERKANISQANRDISKNFAKDFFLQRLFHGVVASTLVTTTADTFFPFANQAYPFWVSVLFVLIFLIQVFRPIDRYTALSNNWMLASGAVLYILIHSLVKVTFLRDLDYLMPVTSQEVFGFSLLLIPTAIFYIIGKRYAKKLTQ
jgi:hypothetical protein